VWAKNNLGAALGTGKGPAAAATTDPRAIVFLNAGEKALADGNLDFAKESFDKASALAEKDPRVLLDLARLAAVRADGAWLKSRLLPSDAADEHRITRETLGDLAATARRAADDALAAAPEDPAALRAKIDALRISGDRDGARGLVSRIGAGASQPESAYVLAALDLAEAAPLWSTVIERLRTAAGVETGPGRARAALVYALVLSGDTAGAKAEADRLAALPKVHPLLPLLRQFADRNAKTSADAGAAVAATGHAPPGEPGTKEPGKKPLPTDPRQLVSQGDAARHKGDYDRARQLYAAALDRNANDSEALYGLAAIAHAQRDLGGAKASYKRVLSINPNYLPALIGVADVDWESGDKASAQKIYKEIVERYPEGAYPGRVKQRVEGGGG
jgi:tetratricopeptide (TPR) repeat protein